MTKDIDLNSFIAAVPPAGRQGGASRLAPYWTDIRDLRARGYSWAQIAEFIAPKAGFSPTPGDLSVYHSRQIKRSNRGAAQTK